MGQRERRLHHGRHGVRGVHQERVPDVHDAGQRGRVGGGTSRLARAADQDPQVAGLDGGSLHRGDVRAGGHGHRALVPGEHGIEGAGPQVQGAGERSVLLPIQGAGLRGVLHELADGGGVVAAGGGAVHGGHAAPRHEAVGHHVGEQQQRAHGPHERPRGQGHRLRGGLGVGDGPGLGRHLTHHQVEERHGQ